MGKKTIEKSNNNMIILFCNKLIDLDKNFLNKIKSLFLNDEPCKITHIGDEFSETPIEIGNIKIYNKFHLNLTKELLNYLNEKELPDTFKNELIYVILNCLKFDNPKSNITYFIDNFLPEFIKEFKFDAELMEDSILEFKSKDYFFGTDNDIVEKLTQDITKKLKENDYKLYLIGYDEKSKQYDAIPSHSLSDSRIDNIKTNIEKQLEVSNFNLMKIPFDKHNCIIMISVKK